MTSVNVNNLEIQVNESGHVTFTRDGVTWKFREGFQPRLECEEGILNFEDALSISRDVITSGVGEGIRSHYEGFKAGNQTVPYSFDTIVWVEAASSDVFFEWVPLDEEGLTVRKIYWPGEMEFDEKNEKWYTLLNHQQGLLIPNTWET